MCLPSRRCPIRYTEIKRESFSAVTRLSHNVLAHNAVRSKRSAVNEADKTANVVNTTADDYASKRKSRVHCQTNLYDDCVSAQLTSTRLRFS